MRSKRPPMDEDSYKKLKIARIIEKKQRAKYLSSWYYKFPNEYSSTRFKKNSEFFEAIYGE